MSLIDTNKARRIVAAIRRGESMHRIRTREQCSSHPVYRLAAEHNLTLVVGSGETIPPEVSAARVQARLKHRQNWKCEAPGVKSVIPISEIMLQGVED